MDYYIWLDDIRPIPPYIKDDYSEDEIFWAKTYQEAVDFFINNIRPVDSFLIDFDNDLGEEKEGYDLAKWLLENGYRGTFRVHSMNPVAKHNIIQMLTHYGWNELHDGAWY